jgi:glycosyltransferase involved in cell wall biosynthesis
MTSKREAKSGKLRDVVDDAKTAANLAEALQKIDKLDRQACRTDFEARFTLERMARDHVAAYQRLIAG